MMAVDQKGCMISEAIETVARSASTLFHTSIVRTIPNVRLLAVYISGSVPIVRRAHMDKLTHINLFTGNCTFHMAKFFSRAGFCERKRTKLL